MNKQRINSSPAIIALQMCSGFNPDDNIAALKQALAELPSTRPLLVCLPEAFLVEIENGSEQEKNPIERG